MHLLRSDRSNIEELAEALVNLKKGIVLCGTCWNVSEADPCKICDDESRERKTVCVVEDVMDALALERTRQYRGLYHVLHGKISPLNNVSPHDLKIQDLHSRVAESAGKNGSAISEIILATNPDMEGEATAMYIAELLKPLKVKITRIARGLPTGGHVEYADDLTLSNAMEGRREF